jgi:23S rRNA (pseudouridine1915-N3)-methyltransferase
MLIRIVCVGKTKKPWLQAGEAEYARHLKKYATLEWIVVAPVIKGSISDIIQAESAKIESICDKFSDSDMYLLDVSGRQYTSEQFAQAITDSQTRGKLVFIIGGSHGVSSALSQKIPRHISFSRMTFVHEMIRVFVLEQLFRACDIAHGGRYHK